MRRLGAAIAVLVVAAAGFAPGAALGKQPQGKGAEQASGPGAHGEKGVHGAKAKGGPKHDGGSSPAGHGKGLEKKSPPVQAEEPPAASAAPKGPVPPAGGPAAHGQAAPHEKVTLCHATGSPTNPFVVITVSVNAATGNGHGLHEDDIIPAPAGGCPGAGEDPGEDPGGDPGANPGGGDPGDGDSPQSPKGPDPDVHGSGVQSAAGSGDLPFTGLPAWMLLALGAVLVAGGAALRAARVPASK